MLELQGYLKALEDTAVVVVSHDRAFLDEVAQEIIVFRNKKLTYHAGGLVSGLSANHSMTFYGIALWVIILLLLNISKFSWIFQYLFQRM